MSKQLVDLKKEGWLVDESKLRLNGLIDEEELKSFSASEDRTRLIDVDIKDYGSGALTEKLDKKRGEAVGPIVLQLARWRNVSRPKVPEHLDSDGLCKMTLVDGVNSVEALHTEPISGLTGRTPFGTKLLLTGIVPYEGGMLLIDTRNCKVLGGSVEKLIEKWQYLRIGGGVKPTEVAAGAPKFELFDERGGRIHPNPNTRPSAISNQSATPRTNTSASVPEPAPFNNGVAELPRQRGNNRDSESGRSDARGGARRGSQRGGEHQKGRGGDSTRPQSGRGRVETVDRSDHPRGQQSGQLRGGRGGRGGIEDIDRSGYPSSNHHREQRGGGRGGRGGGDHRGGRGRGSGDNRGRRGGIGRDEPRNFTQFNPHSGFQTSAQGGGSNYHFDKHDFPGL